MKGMSRSDIQKMTETDDSLVLNVPIEGVIGQGPRESSVSVIFWISERLIPFIHSQVIYLNGLHFLCEEGISEIKIEDVYLLTTPPAEVRGFSDCVQHLLFCSEHDLPTSPLSVPHSQSPSLRASMGFGMEPVFWSPRPHASLLLCAPSWSLCPCSSSAAPLAVFMSVFSVHLNGLGRL